MKKKILIGNIGAAVIALLLVSSATAMNGPITQTINVNEVFEREEPDISNELYVDPDICLTSDDLHSLQDSLAKVEDDDVAQLTGQIISAIEDNGVVTGMEIGMMAYEEGETGLKAITSGYISGTAVGTVWIPGKLKLIAPGGALWVALTPSVIFWSAIDDPHLDINIQVGSKYLHNPHSGIGIGFVGLAYDQPVYGPSMDIWGYVGIDGVAALIFWS